MYRICPCKTLGAVWEWECPVWRFSRRQIVYSNMYLHVNTQEICRCIFKISIWANVNNSDGDDNRVDSFTSLPPLGNMSISLAKHQWWKRRKNLLPLTLLESSYTVSSEHGSTCEVVDGIFSNFLEFGQLESHFSISFSDWTLTWLV